MEWTAESEAIKGVSHYDHVISETPFGKIIIEWKGWKSDLSYDIMLNNEWIGVEYSLEDAKQTAYNYLIGKYNALGLFLKQQST